MDFSRIIERHAQFAPARCAVHCAGEDVSYSELWRRIAAATASLHGMGVRPGDRIAYLGLNDPAVLVLLFALARLGAILLPLNFRLAPVEHEAILRHAGATLLLADPVHAVQAAQLAAAVGRAAAPLASLARGGTLPDGAVCGDDDLPLLLVYTSGTTGKPKGALHTQAGLIWNCVMSTHAHDFSPADHVLTALPLFHVGGLCIQTLPALHAGATVTLHARFEPGAWLRDVQARRPSISLLVPATLKAVLEHPEFMRTDLGSLKLLNAGSSVIPQSMIAAVHARGVPLCQVYGATETGPVSIYLRREDAFAKAGAAGKAALHVEVRLVDSAGGVVAHGEVGEILVRGKNVMREYWNDPANPAFRDGWFHSGDLAFQDEDGFYNVVGRSKDMIISGGENIYPAELENVLADVPQVLEAAVIGRPDARWGEVAVAVIVARPGSALDAAAVLRMFEGRLARFKHPRQVVFVDALPKTALGKVQKDMLKGQVLGAPSSRA
jgi:fatty-acyl-CoA synthase